MFKQGIVLSSLLLAVWLVSAREVGLLGCWAWMVALGIVALLFGLIAYAEWLDRDKERRNERKSMRMTRKMIEQTNKERYLRSI